MQTLLHISSSFTNISTLSSVSVTNNRVKKPKSPAEAYSATNLPDCKYRSYCSNFPRMVARLLGASLSRNTAPDIYNRHLSQRGRRQLIDVAGHHFVVALGILGDLAIRTHDADHAWR